MEVSASPKKRIFLWTLYDFANSIAIIVFTLYFSQWLVVEQGVSDLWYNMLFVGSTVLVLLTAPILGAIADKRGVQMPYLRWTTILQFLGLLAAGLLAVAFPAHRGVVFGAAISFLIANWLYQLTFTFYNALLVDVAPPGQQGRVSGLGQAANLFGSVTGLLITLPLATGAIYFFGNPGREQVFVPATIIFLILALPVLLFFKDRHPARDVQTSVKEEYRRFIQAFRSLVKHPGVGRYLLAYFFFNDAMLTASNNIAIYLEQVFHVPDKMKSFFLLGVFITSVVGALISSRVADKVGLKRSLLVLLACWIIIFPILGALTNFIAFTVFAACMGILFGGTWTVTRAVMAYLIPSARINEGFSYYTLAERVSTFVGPLAWGLITFLLVDYGVVRYHAAMMSMGVFALIGFLIARKIPSDRHIAA